MKMNNVSLMKLTIRLLILMVFFVILFLILAVLYSSRYWPDVYNYINANITIKRIPTITELNLTILEVDATTEYYSTIEDYAEASTVEGTDIDIDDFTNIPEDMKSSKRSKRFALADFGKDYNELPIRSAVVDYLFLDEPTTVYEEVIVTKIVRDLIADSKLVPKYYGDVEIMDSMNEVDSQKLTESLLTDGSPILPWIATIFIKNDTKSNQFEYYCDGALLNEKLLITAARCVNRGNSTVAVEDILVILGKKSLLAMADKEQAVKIKQILTHENFTNENGKTDNDLALLVLEAPAVFNEIIQPATFGNDTDEEEKWSSAFTTAWNLAGAIVPVSLEKKDDKARKDCVGESAAENMICAAYGLDVPLCPSYGGILGVAETETWRLHGIRSGDPEDRGICLNKNIWFTELRPYKDWILEHME